MSHRVRRFDPADREGMAAFAAALPEHDLLFLGRDLRHPRVVEAWLAAIAEGWIDSLVAEDEGTGALIGTAALVRDPLGWSPHVGEVRLLVSADRRGAGLGRDLLEGVFAIAQERGLAKLIAQMTPDQTGAVTLFENLGFRGEALLRDHVRDPTGATFDLAILSYDAGRVAARHDAFGVV
ncbi:GNAT family N-acetyltransferase [uncultured Sphingomonas sp.]|uniref:GNAT family N-acetyltransferase n=1 Tax=uncultured Sphingomonas sp. TaxID=158754 RepID=UPI0035CB8D7B